MSGGEERLHHRATEEARRAREEDFQSETPSFAAVPVRSVGHSE
jgi:hypothetical protein